MPLPKGLQSLEPRQNRPESKTGMDVLSLEPVERMACCVSDEKCFFEIKWRAKLTPNFTSLCTESQPIDSINDKGKPVRNHACQCKDGRLMLVNWRGTAVAPDGAGTATIIVTQPDGTKIEIDPKDWALSLKQFPACQDILPESLSADGVQPAECASNLVMGSTCTEGCAATLKALGQECYSAAKYVIANPEIIKLSP